MWRRFANTTPACCHGVKQLSNFGHIKPDRQQMCSLSAQHLCAEPSATQSHSQTRPNLVQMHQKRSKITPINGKSGDLKTFGGISNLIKIYLYTLKK
jgi:hypothetical protein